MKKGGKLDESLFRTVSLTAIGLIRRPKIKQNGSDCGDEEDEEDKDEEEETMHNDFFKSKTFRGTCIICND